MRKFKEDNPGFDYRLVVPKDPQPGLVPKAVLITVWLKDTFGVKGVRWINQPAVSPDYLVYWFREEPDLMWTRLRWQ